MARETYSERTVRIANRHYSVGRRARVVKVDPGIRLTSRQLIYTSSRGLDYSGTLFPNGQHIEFEVKETQKLYLPFSNLRIGQIWMMQELTRMGADAFLLVFFSQNNEWYRLECNELNRIIEDYAQIPILYFRAFGFQVPCDEGWPRYLDPEKHHDSNKLINSFPHWMPKKRKPREPKAPIPSPNHLDPEARRNRIIAAIDRGIKNARKKEIQVEQIKLWKKLGQ